MTDAKAREDLEVARLRAVRDALEAKLEAHHRRARTGGWGRRTLAALLVVLACVSFAAAVPGVWARRNFLDTDRFVSRAAPLIEDPAVQEAISLRLTEQLMLLIDPRELFQEVLPERGQLLAVPLTNAVDGFVADRVETFVASDRFAELWESALTVAHGTSVDVLRSEGGDVVTTEDGQVTLNLVPVVNAVLGEITSASPEILGREIDLPDVTVDDIPQVAIARIEEALDVELDDDFGQITVYDDDTLALAQDGVSLFDQLVVVLLPLSVVFAGLALWVSKRRRRTLLQLTVGVAIGMVLIRRVSFGVQDEVAALPPRVEGHEAAAVVLDTFLDPLLTFAMWALGAALVVAAVALVTGPYPWAVSLRRRVSGLASSLVSATGERARDEATVTWIRAHRDVLLVGGALFGFVVLWTADLSWAGLLVVLALVGGFEAIVHRIGAPLEVR